MTPHDGPCHVTWTLVHVIHADGQGRVKDVMTCDLIHFDPSDPDSSDLEPSSRRSIIRIRRPTRPLIGPYETIMATAHVKIRVRRDEPYMIELVEGFYSYRGEWMPLSLKGANTKVMEWELGALLYSMEQLARIVIAVEGALDDDDEDYDDDQDEDYNEDGNDE